MTNAGFPLQPPGEGPDGRSLAFDPAAGSQPPPSIDPVTAEAVRILGQPPAQRTWQTSALILVVSLVLFAMTGLFKATIADLALLIGVLFFHEMGHYLGMRLFNYQDVRMFFIPFFGAAVSGRKTSVAGYQEAIVLLAGPLPGIVLGLILGAVCLNYDSPLLRTAAGMLIGINGFNLLPLMPLDGGRILHLIVFSRQRHVEAIFQVVAAVLLGLCAWALSAWFLGILAFFMLIGVSTGFRISKLAQQLRPLVHEDANPAAPIPHEWAIALVERVRHGFPQIAQPAQLANVARQVWDRMHLRPPGLLASVAILMLYGGTFFVTPVAFILFQIPRETVVAVQQPDGSQKQVQEVRVWGRLHTSTELGADGQPHGRHVEYFPGTDQIHIEGAFADGKYDGAWTTYLPDGQVESRELFRNGEAVVEELPPVRP